MLRVGETDLPHGYVRYTCGCRCDTCKAAKAAYMRERRAKAVANAQPGVRVYSPSHGTRFAYEERGCRCEECITAQVADDAKYYPRVRANRDARRIQEQQS